MLNGVRYEPGSTVSITDVGTSEYESGYANADSSLMCVTSHVNTQCCREEDGQNMGEWHYPNGSMVHRNRYNREGDFTRSGYTHEVRLNRRNSVISPSGTYSCRVPGQGNCGSLMHVANITLGKPGGLVCA